MCMICIALTDIGRSSPALNAAGHTQLMGVRLGGASVAELVRFAQKADIFPAKESPKL